ncbi:Major Facilitator Superfamily protein [Limihaloglobus sulfuriphilus]|uniref:Major Facilitator Superfamily protein n=1 Tax=Limihaloglobus sulfuriphilus TaxID=1851148 RepID=A0A1Q2MHG9_9BACT|nr:MFS transporter [Limihaloglobus sulfuriphilus]AQQ72155.1 Major Facilitator Superfamily protein [Limihaloglobus sulfuriphilus]
MPEPKKNNTERLSPAKRRDTIRMAYLVSIFMTTGNVCLMGPPFQLFAIKLGCSEFYLGLINFILWSAGLFGIFGIKIIEKYGKIKCLIICRTISLVISLGFALLAFLASASRLHYGLILAAIIPILLLRSIFSGIGSSGWFPILQDNVPPRIRGSFFASLRTKWQIAALTANLALMFILGKDAGFTRIGFVLLFSCLIMLYSVLFLKNMNEAPPLPDSEKPSIRRRFMETLKSGRIRRFLVYIVSYNLAVFISSAFQIKYMKQLGYSDAHVIAVTATISAGAILSLRFWGRIADSYGNRALLSISHLGVGVSLLAWIFIGNSTASFIFIMFAVAARSIFHHGNGIAQTRYMLSAVPEDKQGMIVIINIFMTFSIAVAPLLGGFFLTLTGGLQPDVLPLGMNHYQMLFILSSLMMIVPHSIRKGFRVAGETPTAQVLMLLQRPTLNRLNHFVRIAASPVKGKDKK